MNDLEVLKGITDPNMKQLCKHFQLKTKAYEKQELIANASNDSNMIGIMLSGIAYLTTINLDYQKRILEYYESNDIFWNSTMQYLWNSSSAIYAKTKCTVAYLDYRLFFKSNNDALIPVQRELIEKSRGKVLQHIEILSQLTLRNKLIAYFEYCKKRYNSRSFTIPLTYSDLAEYLAVDRSAMMRELARMKEDNIINSNKRNITLIKES